MALSVAVLAILIWRLDQPPFDLVKLDRLTPGMTQSEVRQVLGVPSSKSGDSWQYSGWMSWPIVYVYFDESGGFAKHRYDF